MRAKIEYRVENYLYEKSQKYGIVRDEALDDNERS